jgi:phosphatidylglycerol:prolipoprotein diacylglycerol transferase
LFLGRRLKDWLLEGDVFLMYLIWYPLGRFWIELLFRPDAWTIGTMPTASLFSLGAIVLGAAGIAFNHRFRRKPVPMSVPAAPASIAKTGTTKAGGGKKSGARS